MEDTTVMNKPKAEEKVVLTEKAVQEVQLIKSQNNIPETHGLRVGVKGGGCSGFSYVLGFDASPHEGDLVFDSKGVTMFVDPKSLEYVSGTELDFTDGLNGRGFVFNNPHATKTCGCGNSFAV